MIKRILITLFIFLGISLPVLAFDFMDAQSGLMQMPDTSPEAQKYNLEIAKKIIANFELPDTNEHLSTVIIFKLDTRGGLKSYEVTQSSGNSDYDNRVITAIHNSVPYPLPTHQNVEDVTIMLNMDLSILKLIKMLSGQFGIDLVSPTPKPTPTTPKQVQIQEPEPQKPEPTKRPLGKKFITPEELEKLQLE